MRDFAYHRPRDLAEALALLADDDEAMVLAGGQTLLPTLKQGLNQPSALIDLSGIAGLSDIREVAGGFEIGAMATHAAVAGDPGLLRRFPAFARLARLIGDPHIRNRGTIGGSLANNDPSADYPAALLACGAVIVTDRSEFQVEEFFAGLFTTALDFGEIITRIKVPQPRRFGYASIRNPASRYASTGVAVAERQDGTTVVAVTGAGQDGVYRWSEAEARLNDDFSVAVVESLMPDADDMIADARTPGAYRAALVLAMTKAAVRAAHQQQPCRGSTDGDDGS